MTAEFEINLRCSDVSAESAKLLIEMFYRMAHENFGGDPAFDWDVCLRMKGEDHADSRTGRQEL